MIGVDRRERLTRLADSYLDHLRIAVEVGDKGAPYRDFIDNWAALVADADHHRSRGDRPRWFNNPDAIARREMLWSLPFRSAGAEAILRHAANYPADYRDRRKANDPSMRLIVDHAIPINVIVGELLRDSADLSRERIRRLLQRSYCLGLLGWTEDALLRQHRLGASMPTTWDGTDLTARYRAVGIVEACALRDGVG